LQQLHDPNEVIEAYYSSLRPFWHPILPSDELENAPVPPLSSRMMLYVRPADLPLVAFQKWLEELSIPQEV